MGGQTSKSYQFKHGDVINGRIDHINIGNSTSVDCYNLRDLTELPLWPNVTKVWCYDCPSLTELPLWPNVTEVDRTNCRGRTLSPIVYTSFDRSKVVYTDNELSNCIVCTEVKKDVVIDPCYHLYTCAKCTERIYKTTKRCPVCNGEIQKIIPWM